jgi:broad-specificity NMP kinase
MDEEKRLKLIALLAQDKSWQSIVLVGMAILDDLVDAIMNSSEAELREEIKERGEDPDKILAGVDATLVGAKTAAAERRMERARVFEKP